MLIQVTGVHNLNPQMTKKLCLSSWQDRDNDIDICNQNQPPAVRDVIRLTRVYITIVQKPHFRRDAF